MAPRPRDTPAAPGLLASAFSFVSRELESFVTAATGGDLQHKATTSRVTLDGRRKEREDRRDGRSDRDKERERERRAKRVRKRSEVDNERARAKRRLREEDDEERAPRVTKKRVQATQDRERSSEREAADDEDGWSEELPVRPLPKALKKRRDAVAKGVDPEVDEDAEGPKPQPQPADRGKKSSRRTFGGEQQLYTEPYPVLN
uniref:N/A n=1 Tax=Ganoderma boninense TaxID=34458 RepID=A0A5K1K4V3_9APHY|nr:N/A [Ganoderma boninense]